MVRCYWCISILIIIPTIRCCSLTGPLCGWSAQVCSRLQTPSFSFSIFSKFRPLLQRNWYNRARFVTEMFFRYKNKLEYHAVDGHYHSAWLHWILVHYWIILHCHDCTIWYSTRECNGQSIWLGPSASFNIWCRLSCKCLQFWQPLKAVVFYTALQIC